MKFRLSVLLIFITSLIASAQVETVPVGNFVYDYLKILSVKGIISNYDDIVLPLSKGKIEGYLTEATKNINNLTEVEKSLLDKIKLELGLGGKDMIINITDIFPHHLSQFFDDNKAKYFYSYKDSVLNFYVNPIFGDIFLYSRTQNNTSNLFNFGGKFYGSYNDWFGFYASASNGYASGNRSVAELNNTIRQSFTFNDTKINFFDNTEGYIRIEKKPVALEIGRERILWGRGINKLIVSDNAPEFDFIRLNAVFNIISIDYLHGWLVQPAYSTYDSSVNNYIKNKNPKYIAVGRIGINPSNNISFGLTQTIIYANRPIELAYLNPFLFFESAQRSLNDLDNSFLGLDTKIRLINGMELSSIINFDDINFSSIKDEGFGSLQTRYAWQTNLMLSNPILPDNLSIGIDFVIIRPYVYSHFGIGESLTYTNNGFLLGPDLQPNSIRISFRANYLINSDLFVKVEYNNTQHGGNIYDSKGILIRNVGGDIYDYFRLGDSEITKILDGQLQIINNIKLETTYELIPGFYLSLHYEYYNSQNSKENYLWGSFEFRML